MKPTLCLSLRTGTLIAGILDLVLFVSAFVGSLWLLVDFELREEEVLGILRDLKHPNCLDGFINVRKISGRTLRIFLAFLVFYSIQKLGLAILLLHGVRKDKKGYIRVWLFYSLILLILSVLFFLSAILLSVLDFKGIPLYVAAFLLREYTFWIVSSRVKEMEEIDPKKVGMDEVNYLPNPYLPHFITEVTKENWEHFNDTTVDMTLKEGK